jgi:hypothetical protein
MPRDRGHRYHYRVEIRERATYEAVVEADTAAEACRKAERLFLSKDGITIKPPFSVDVHDRIVGATLLMASRAR